MRTLLPAGVAFLLMFASAFAGEAYVVDKTQSEAKFEIRYLLGTVSGKAKNVSGVIQVDALNPTSSSVNFSVEAGSIETGSSEIDSAVRSTALLDVTKYPHIVFESSTIKNRSTANLYQVLGDLTLHGVTKKVVLSVEFLGTVKEADGKMRAGFMARTTLNRKDYGITWNKVLDQSSVLGGDEIEVTVNLSATSK
jgi:polyisoprenoid-binding protein YceI